MKVESPLVTVAIPAYNRPDALRRTLDALLVQTYDNIEIIISDDCSPNRTNDQVLKEYSERHSHIEVFLQNKNLGPRANNRFLLSKAKGEFFIFHPDDDWIDPEFIEKCVKYLQLHPSVALVSGRCVTFNPDVKEYNGLSSNLTIRGEWRSLRVLKYHIFLRHNSIYHGLMRRSVVQMPGDGIGDDILIVSRLAFLGEIVTLNGFFMHRLKTVESQSQQQIFDKSSPYVSMARDIYRDILNHSSYRPLSKIGRKLLALSVVMITLGKRGHVIFKKRCASIFYFYKR